MWETAGTVVGVLSPLVAVPLTMITFYLRSMHEHQTTWHTDMSHRIERLESSITELRRAFSTFERDYTTKEEWLREYMQAKRTMEQLSESVVRIETILDVSAPRAADAARRPA